MKKTKKSKAPQRKKICRPNENPDEKIGQDSRPEIVDVPPSMLCPICGRVYCDHDR